MPPRRLPGSLSAPKTSSLCYLHVLHFSHDLGSRLNCCFLLSLSSAAVAYPRPYSTPTAQHAPRTIFQCPYILSMANTTQTCPSPLDITRRCCTLPPSLFRQAPAPPLNLPSTSTRNFTHDTQRNTRHGNIQSLASYKCSTKSAIIPSRGLPRQGPASATTKGHKTPAMHRPRRPKIEDVVWLFFGCSLKPACSSSQNNPWATRTANRHQPAAM